MSSNLSPSFGTNFPSDTTEARTLSIALIGPDQRSRRTVSLAIAQDGRTSVSEFESYPKRSDEVRWLLEQSFDVIVLDLDGDPDVALDLVGKLSVNESATVMVYSEQADTKLAVRYMRAGAREFLLLPFEEGIVAEALSRAREIRVEKPQPAQGTAGNLFVFVAGKGGCGATTLSCNLAIALAGSNQKTLLIDLALPIGDAALALGVTAEYSTEDAIRNAGRLDARLLHQLLIKHRSGLFVLAAPSDIPGIENCGDAIDTLIAVARREFDHVIVDVGSRIDLMGTTLFRQASTVYLVTLSGVSELRNSNRLISQFFPAGGPNLEIVINRFESRLLGGINEDDVAKALGRPVRWSAPEDRDVAREMQYGETGVGNTRISRLTLEMATAISERTVPQERKRDTRPDTRQETRLDARQETRLDTRQETRLDTRQETRLDTRQETRPDTRQETRLDTRPDTRPRTPAKPAAAEEDYGDVAQPSTRIAPPPAAKAAPAISWTPPAPILYGVALSVAQLNASASVAGNLIYTPAPGTVLPGGTHQLSVSLIPADSGSTGAEATVTIVVERATPEILWEKPNPIRYGTRLGDEQLNAIASVDGRFDYSPAEGELLATGTHTLSVEFIPNESENYVTVKAAVSIEVEISTPAVSWAKPVSMYYGTPLGAGQLNATASVPGHFDYSPAPGELLDAGTHTLSAEFTPDDRQNYVPTKANVTLEVQKATPAISWPKPDPIRCNMPLGDGQLNATASVPGRFDYSPAPGKLLATGPHMLSVTFTPNEAGNYTTTKANVPLFVETLVPVIAWSSPDPIPYGTRLSASQLCATTDVAGTFDYSVQLGKVLPAGIHTLTARFTPADTENYATVEASVELIVDKSRPAIAWPSPDPIPNGTQLNEKQLCATASVPGRFDYSPRHGAVLPAGTHRLSVTFTPSDTENYAKVDGLVTLHVAKARPVVEWTNPDPIRYGTKLSAKQLCAMASVSGKFDYTPALGEVLSAGAHTLSATFIPSDSENYAPVQAAVSLEVAKAIPVIEWPAPHTIRAGAALGDQELCATSPLPGTFEYTPGPGQALAAGTHTLSVTFTPTDIANYATTNATVSIKFVDKPTQVIASTKADRRNVAGPATFIPSESADFATKGRVDSPEVEKTSPLIEWPTAEPKHSKQLKPSQHEIPPPTPTRYGEPLPGSEVLVPRANARNAKPLSPEPEKPKQTQARVEPKVEPQRGSSKLPPSARSEESPKLPQKFNAPSHSPKASAANSEVVDPLDWLTAPAANRATPVESDDDEPSESWFEANKKLVIMVAGASVVLLAALILFLVLHSSAKNSAKGTVTNVSVATETPTDSQGSTSSPTPQATQNKGDVKPAPGQTQAASDQAVATPSQAQPSATQTEMMRNQLNAQSRIQRQGAPNAPPPSNFSAAGLGGNGAMGNVFAGGNTPAVVAAGPHGPVAVPGDIAMRLLTQRTLPVYPSIAKQARVSGTVQLLATISKTGTIESLHVVSGPSMLRDAAVEAVKSWRYRPYIVSNQAVEIETTINVAFSLGQ